MTAYIPRHARNVCGRWRFLWPWFCTRPVTHPGGCDLHFKPWRIR